MGAVLSPPSSPGVRLEAGGGEAVLTHVSAHQLCHLQTLPFRDRVHQEPLVYEMLQRVDGYIHTHITGQI